MLSANSQWAQINIVVVVDYLVFLYPTRYTETKQVETRVLGHTWELNSRPLAQKAVHLLTILILAPEKIFTAILIH